MKTVFAAFTFLLLGTPALAAGPCGLPDCICGCEHGAVCICCQGSHKDKDGWTILRKDGGWVSTKDGHVQYWDGKTWRNSKPLASPPPNPWANPNWPWPQTLIRSGGC